MERYVIKILHGVLLRAHLTVHGHPTPHFGRKGLDGHVLLDQSSKGLFFHNVLLHY